MGLTVLWSSSSAYAHMPRLFHGPNCFTISTCCPYVDLCSRGYFGMNLALVFVCEACGHLKSPRSLSARSLYLLLVTKRPWSWSPFHFTSIGLPFLRYSCLKVSSWKSKVKVVTKVKTISYICGLVFSLQSDHIWHRYSKFHIWHWQFKVKVMAKVTSDGRI